MLKEEGGEKWSRGSMEMYVDVSAQRWGSRGIIRFFCFRHLQKSYVVKTVEAKNIPNSLVSSVHLPFHCLCRMSISLQAFTLFCLLWASAAPFPHPVPSHHKLLSKAALVSVDSSVLSPFHWKTIFHFSSLYCKPALPSSSESFAFDWNYIAPLAPLQILSACCVPSY